MDILFPTGRLPARTGRWTALALGLLVPPLVCWAALLLHLVYRGGSPADVLLERLSPQLRVAAMVVSPAVAAAIGLAVRRRAASQAAKLVARTVAVCGAALVLLAVLAALGPS
jgi:hypothetical protein